MGALWADEVWQKYIDWQEQDKTRLDKGILTVLLVDNRLVFYKGELLWR